MTLPLLIQEDNHYTAIIKETREKTEIRHIFTRLDNVVGAKKMERERGKWRGSEENGTTHAQPFNKVGRGSAATVI